MPTQAAFFGCSGLRLTPDEIAFFKEVKPAGFILFARNCDTPEQLKTLCASLAELCVISPAPILIDQEGGRVARLRPPHWLPHPPAAVFGALYERDPQKASNAVKAHGALIGAELAGLGITVDCLPVLDVLFPETHDVIGDRAFSQDADVIAHLGQALMDGLMSSGVVPVIKHIPGHGRATADSHLSLPVVSADHAALSKTDFQPFKACAAAPMAMTAHILYTQLDAAECATHSKHIIETIIRGEIGFDGLLMSDDVSMKALGGGLEQRARKALDAGCDIVLHCNGDMAEMQAVAAGVCVLEGRAAARLHDAMLPAANNTSISLAALVAERQEYLGDVWTT